MGNLGNDNRSMTILIRESVDSLCRDGGLRAH